VYASHLQDRAHLRPLGHERRHLQLRGHPLHAPRGVRLRRWLRGLLGRGRALMVPRGVELYISS
jgi:hypothetical protein